MSIAQTEDLKAFERRLMEVISQVEPTSRQAKYILIVSLLFVLYTFWMFLTDPLIYKVSLLQSFKNHPLLSLSLCIFLILYLKGFHHRMYAPQSIAAGCRNVLNDFNMSCDDAGKLILRPCTHYKG
ncbi:unnamed protein product [Gordionus sp. m RMFG-2023]|uniref:nuclear envelope phosphatase-regulatory subunit 1-like n=1 Tax=Gordionus sp. m RMFG-2023 TaxID=3053472 RepID=UPI0030E32788